ncbi:MAG TPA: PSD1 and planctomycete cytochrome C domain-containing protein [Bryobacteraceae bacterium]|nr:PSD1 and planctomycete cytochrome C domain-containing protein [Bryobacteraceae bacterium]
MLRAIFSLFLVHTATADTVEQAARRVLEKQCLACHGAAKMSGLDLRQREAILKGGTRGPAVNPGYASDSILYQAVQRNGDLKMPPGKATLTPNDITAIRQWIDAGAPWTGAASAEPTWWSFRKPTRPPLPAVNTQNPIDRFLVAKRAEQGLVAAPSADRRTLIRRATVDLHGLPPTPEEIDTFLSDTSARAYQELIDRLLASPRYGEKWGRHWLDVVRYADTGGFETDVYFANAWRYRDYVIRSFNNDKPYNVFVQEQVAADEIWPDNLDLEGSYDLPKSKLANLEKRIGTGLFTLGALPVEFAFIGDQYRAEWQAEAVDTTGAAFLGLSLNCARCHDHKFDPISQRDYYRLSAIFAGSEDREVPIVSQMGIFEYTRFQTKVIAVEQLKAKLQRLEAAAGQRQGLKGKYAKAELSPAERDLRESLLRQIGDAYVKAPTPYAKANLLVHTEPVPDTHILVRGDFKQLGEKVKPGLPGALGPSAEIEEPATNLFIPRRRKALAEWLTSPNHPLTARVMVNRIWQGHFGQGIVATANDFGRQGDAPSHPELLDWLAVEFMRNNWSMKSLHKQILLSDAYQLSSLPIPANLQKDPANKYLWRMNRRRLEAESIRDAVLAVSGALNSKMFGPSVVPALSEEERDGMRDMSMWPVTSDLEEHARRSIYLFIKRSFRHPLMETFDAPDSTFSCPRREASTVAPQSLAMMNGEFMNTNAAKFAARIGSQQPTLQAQVELAWRVALGRVPEADEKQRAIIYAKQAGLPKLCLLLFNMSEFIYVD